MKAVNKKLRRTIVRIVNVDEKPDKDIDVLVIGWNPHEIVRLPASLIPEDIRSVLKQNMRLFAYVNTGTEKSDDLYFEKFELAPEPDEGDGLV